jgi:uncharacterized protein YjbI with pentapeptide repeats
LIDNPYILEAQDAGFRIAFNRGSRLEATSSKGNLLRPDILIRAPGGRYGSIDWTTEGSTGKIFKYGDQADAPWLINVTLPWECIMALIHDRWSEHQPLDIRALLLSSDECRSPFSVTDEGHCDFRGVRIDASFHKMTVRHVDFSSAVLGDGQFVGACDDCKFVEFVCDGNLGREFLNCVFHKARLNNSVFYGKFLNCDFSDANMTGVRGRHSRFERCTFENTNLRKASFYDSTFVDCKLINCTIRSGSLAGSSFDNCEMNDFDLSKTVMARVKGLE